ncbi:lipopolysaccharide biosynthesis protein [Pseudonocardia spirodelae]|uniref:Lipopolysaccharide biosynthesis protein n=1 Tax=Pseudonocardia spirodelae TaxID=3133431 RepID=A0ABU8T3P7_9PSEU
MSVEDARSMRPLTVLRDIGFVSFGKYGQYVVTAVTVPLSARLLGTEGVGHLAVGMSAYFIGSLLVDMGIAQFLSAEVPRGDVRRLRGTYLAIRSTILSVLLAGLAAGLLAGVPELALMVLLGLVAGGLFAMSDDWVLIGQGRFGTSMAYQAVGRALYLVLLVGLLPHFPYAWVALLCLLVSSFPAIVLTWWTSTRTYGTPGRPSGVRAVLRLGGPVLTSRLLIASYGQGSGTVYASVLDAASLGLFSAGDRMVRALQSLLDPIGFALLPRMARVADGDRFWPRAVKALAATTAVALLVAAALWLAAPLLVRVVFGPAFGEAVPLLRLEAFILPFTSVTSFVTTAVLTVRRDTTGVLVGAVLGTVVAAGFLLLALHARSVWVLVWGTLASEATAALWYAARMRVLAARDAAGELPPAAPGAAAVLPAAAPAPPAAGPGPGPRGGPE